MQKITIMNEKIAMVNNAKIIKMNIKIAMVNNAKTCHG